ncbi:MAG: HAMP domain-containing protein [Dactylosporangium sp.]|nr:HAMP domain-containing protein [Dactylosporangium sp.]
MDVQHCGTLVGVTAQERTEILGEALACARMSSGTFRPCLTRLFTDRISPVAPVPLLLYLGAVGRQPLRTLAFPLLVTASVVMVVAVAGGVLLSRRVLRPVGTLTTAARRFGDGDLATRVRVSGHDELAELGCSFNRMAESIQSAEERQRRMVSDVAHELRTPLANLRGYLEALKDGVIAPAPEVFTSLHDEAVLQQLIVEDLQTLALAEAGTLTYQRTLVDLAELLEGCRAAHQAVAAAGEIRLVVRQPGPARVVADHGRLRQVLSNLITNAIRHTQADGTVTLAAESHGTTVIIKVSDTGCGIAEADLPCVFDRFWRADAARRRSTGGSGLGLAIARQIVLDHGGTITVASQVGQGTTFTVTLPGYDPAR